MAIKITSIKDAVVNRGLKILVHGQAGAGKTVLSATTGEPTLIISAESGLLSIKSAPDYVQTTVVETIDDLENVYDYLVNENGLKKFKWIALDSVSEIAEVLLSDEKAASKDPRQAYGNLQDRMMKMLRSFRDLPCNVLMTCKQKRIEDEDTNTVCYVPLLPGNALTQQIPYLFDEVFALRVERKQDTDGNYYDERVIQTGKNARYEAKDRSGELDFFEAPSLRKIAEKIRATMPESEVETVKTLEEIKEKIKDGKDVKVEKEDSEAKEAAKDDGYKIAEKTLYWVHHESESSGIIKKGERYNAAKMEEELAAFVDRKTYDAYCAQHEDKDE